MATMFDNDASNKKVIDSKTFDLGIKQRKYGPFTVELPKLGDDDMYVSNVHFFEKQVHYAIR